MRIALGLATIALCLGCESGRETRPAPAGEARHRDRLVTIGPGRQLEVLDWGGNGPPMVLLAGLGSTAHVFDDFAPALTDSFHVLAFTRRGFGRSAQPPTNSLDTLVADIAALIDSVAVGPVFLVGHSLAGDEITAFAGSHPARCRAVVYLDAAYDRSSLLQLFARTPPPAPSPMTAADSASVAGVSDYIRRAYGIAMPEEEVRAGIHLDTLGRYAGDVTPGSLVMGIVANLPRPQYRRMQCPSLAIYALAEQPQDLIPNFTALDSATRDRGRRLHASLRDLQRHSIAQYASEAPFPNLLVVPQAHHYVFLSHRGHTTRALRAFFQSATPRVPPNSNKPE